MAVADRSDLASQIDIASERRVLAYGASVPGEMFALVVFRCSACGSTGAADSWCDGHSAPLDCGRASVRVKRKPVLVPHADPERPVSEIYEPGAAI